MRLPMVTRKLHGRRAPGVRDEGLDLLYPDTWNLAGFIGFEQFGQLPFLVQPRDPVSPTPVVGFVREC